MIESTLSEVFPVAVRRKRRGRKLIFINQWAGFPPILHVPVLTTWITDLDWRIWTWTLERDLLTWTYEVGLRLETRILNQCPDLELKFGPVWLCRGKRLHNNYRSALCLKCRGYRGAVMRFFREKSSNVFWGEQFFSFKKVSFAFCRKEEANF